MENSTPLPNIQPVKPVKRKHSIIFPPQGMTKQSMQDECNINNIMAKYQTTGLIDFVNKHQPQYGDVTGIDFDTSIEAVTKANAMFAEMPSSMRKRFENDTQNFLDFVQKPENRSEAISMGLIKGDLERRTPEPREERTRASDAPGTPKDTPTKSAET